MSHARNREKAPAGGGCTGVGMVGWSFAAASAVALIRAVRNLAAGLAAGGFARVADSPWVAFDVALFVLWGMGVSGGLALVRKERGAARRVRWIAAGLLLGGLAVVLLRHRAVPDPWWPSAAVLLYLAGVAAFLGAPRVRRTLDDAPKAK